MQQENQDRRIERTKRLLIHALLDLTQEEHYDQISVKDIVEKADVGRSTFYAHFQNKDELLMSGFGIILQNFVDQISYEGGSLSINAIGLFSHAYGHYEIYRTLIWGTGFELLVKDGHSALTAMIAERFTEILPRELPLQIPIEILAYAAAGSLLILLKWWLDHKMSLPPDEINDYFQRLVIPGLQSILDQASTA